MKFNETDLRIIENALRAAERVYQDGARAMRETGPAHERIAEQFDRQAIEANRIADQITDEIG